jgi:hypothetical protein
VLVGHLADDPDAFLVLQARYVALRSTPQNSAVLRSLAVQRLILRGRLREAYAASDSAGFALVSGPAHALSLAAAGAMPRAAADSLFARLSADSTFVSRPFAYAWWYRSGDTLALRRAAEMQQAKTPTASAETQAVSAYAKGIATTYLLLARHDTTTALNTFRQLADSAMGRWLNPIRNDMARVLLARRDFRGAAHMLDSRPNPASSLYYWNIEWDLLRARAAAAMGEQQRARELYGAVAAMWSKADPALRPSVSEAQSGMR